MTNPRYARLVAKILRRHDPEVGGALAVTDRDEAIDLIRHTLERRLNRQRRMRWAVTLGAAAAVLALAGVGLREAAQARKTTRRTHEAVAPATSPPTIVAYSSMEAPPGAGSAAAALVGAPLAAGTRMLAGSKGAKIVLSTGTQLAIDPQSDVSVVEGGRVEAFALRGGTLRADVAKLAPNEQFIVRTPDAEVEVRGTSFQVRVVATDPACPNSNTRVDVYEGVVAVRAKGVEDLVRKGEHWPSSCQSSTPSLLSAKAKEQEPAARSDAPPAAQRGSPLKSTHLAEQNDLFSSGMRLARQSDVAGAIHVMDRFLVRYPDSPLAENALAERMKLLQTTDRPRAQADARLYLSRYPQGFARTDADHCLHAP